MTDSTYTLGEAVNILNIDKATLRKWSNFYEVDIAKNEFGYKALTENQLSFFKQIKKLADNYPKAYKNKHEHIKKIILAEQTKSTETISKKNLPIQQIQETEIKQFNSVNIQAESFSTIDFIMNNLDVKASFTNETLREIIKKNIAYEAQENKRLQSCK